MNKRKIQLGKQILQHKSVDEGIIKEYIDILGIDLDVNEVIQIAASGDNPSKFFDHRRKYGRNATVELYLSRPNTTQASVIYSHYGLEYKPKKRENVYDPKYIMKREGISMEEAIEFIEKYKAEKATTKENFIKKHGEEIGSEKYNQWYRQSLKAGNDQSDASNSKRHRDYYLKRGYSLEEAIEAAAKYNRENSPLHIEYYIKRGMSIDHARKSIRKIHDKKVGIDSYAEKLKEEGFTSDEIKAIIKGVRGHCSREVLGDDEFEARISKTRKTFEERGIWVPLENMSDYERYRHEVWLSTNLNDLSLLDNHERRGLAGVDGAYHLDHKYSIQQGYLNGVPPELIGSVKNLEFIPWEENVKKQNKCGITKEELYEN